MRTAWWILFIPSAVLAVFAMALTARTRLRGGRPVLIPGQVEQMTFTALLAAANLIGLDRRAGRAVLVAGGVLLAVGIVRMLRARRRMPNSPAI